MKFQQHTGPVGAFAAIAKGTISVLFSGRGFWDDNSHTQRGARALKQGIKVYGREGAAIPGASQER